MNNLLLFLSLVTSKYEKTRRDCAVLLYFWSVALDPHLKHWFWRQYIMVWNTSRKYLSMILILKLQILRNTL